MRVGRGNLKRVEDGVGICVERLGLWLAKSTIVSGVQYGVRGGVHCSISCEQDVPILRIM